MSTIIVVSPLIIAGWPVISAAVTSAVASMGFSIAKASAKPQVKADKKVREEIEVEGSELAEAQNQQLVVERGDIRATFSRDARGALKLCIEGEGHSKAELRQIGQDLLERVTQQYVYHRIVTELKDRHMSIVDEQVEADRTVNIRVRIN